MARIACESNRAHVGIDNCASALGIRRAWIEMFAPVKISACQVFNQKQDRQERARQTRFAIRLDSLFLRVIRVPSNLDSLGAVGSRLTTVRLRAAIRTMGTHL
jgi:hypothetical protein